MKNRDFKNDIKQEIYKISNELGFKIKIDDPLKKILRDYFTVTSKIIVQTPREILFNPLVLGGLEENRHKKVIKHIVEVAKSGGDLNIFQSDKLYQTRFKDYLQNEWKIHHFHLSTEIKKNTGFVKRKNALLFVYINAEKIVFLGVSKHEKGIFGDNKWIKVLHDYFPELIAKYKVEDYKGVYPKINSIERQQLRDKGYSVTLSEVGDTVYRSPGIDSKFLLTRSVFEIETWISEIEKQIGECFYELCKYLNVKPSNIDLRIKVNKNRFLLIDEYSHKIIDDRIVFIDKIQRE